MTDEQAELMRMNAQRVLDGVAAGRVYAPESIAWARHVVAHIKPLGRPLSPGDEQLLPPLRGGALEVF